MGIDDESYLREILRDIGKLRLRGKRFLYIINASISSKRAKYIKTFFESTPLYTIEIKKCQSCKNTYDIIIGWSHV